MVVRFRRGASASERTAVQRTAGVSDPHAFAPQTRVLTIKDGASVAATVRELRKRAGRRDGGAEHDRPRQRASTPTTRARAGTPGRLGSSCSGTSCPAAASTRPMAWQHLIDAGRPGGRGVDRRGARHRRRVREPQPLRRVARLRRGATSSRGYDFVDNDAFPNDENGHGTHVASTIGERTGNGIGVTGLAYGARSCRCACSTRYGDGDSVHDHRPGIRYAVKHGANVINLSFEFDAATPVAPREIPDVLAALRYARAQGRRRRRRVRQRGRAPAVAYPARVRRRSSSRRRHDRARLPRGLLELGRGAGHRRPRRRQGRPDDPSCPAGAPSGATSSR